VNRFSITPAAVCALVLATPIAAQQRPAEPAQLSLQEVIVLADSDQPRLLAFESDARASEAAAIAARSLPDLRITAGIQNFPIGGDDAFSPTSAVMTMYTIGVMREQVRRSSREADAARILAEALVSRRQASSAERSIEREAMIAWINAVEARAKQRLLERLIADLGAGREVIEAGVPTGSSTPALALEAQAEVGLAQARLAEARRAEARARAELARWIGSAAERPLPESLPIIELPASPGDEPPAVAAHPQIQVALADQEVATRGIEVARETRKPDLSWSVTLGIRPEYGEMVSASVSLPLQTNRRNRQDRLVDAAQARAGAARLRIEDARRELLSSYRAALANYEGAAAEIEGIEAQVIPSLEAAFSAAEARYAGGGGTLDRPFDIVRRYVEVTMQLVEARARQARAAAEILYVVGEDGR
jgi:outer membrane protein TolC